MLQVQVSFFLISRRPIISNSMNDGKKRVALYARVSTMDQSTGLESQMRVLRTYCEGNQISNYEFFSDEGISGTKSSRPGLDRLMAAVENDEISSVVVYSFSRFGAVGVAIFSILAAISQLERDLVADRVRIGLANARAKGKLIGRKKMRDSDLIRKLLKAGMSYRNISIVAKCSHGSVSAERTALRREEEEAKRKFAEQAEAEKKLMEATIVFPEIKASEVNV